MAFNKEKFEATVIKKYGSIEAYKEAQAEHGRIGGKNGKGHKFAHGKADAKEASKKGLESRWGKNVPTKQ